MVLESKKPSDICHQFVMHFFISIPPLYLFYRSYYFVCNAIKSLDCLVKTLDQT